MTLLILAWLAIVIIFTWVIYGVITLVAGGFLWPFGGCDDEI